MYKETSPIAKTGVDEPTVFRRRIHNQLCRLQERIQRLPDQPKREDVTFFWQLMTSSRASEKQIVGSMAALTVIDDPAAGAALRWYPDKIETGEKLQTFANIAYMEWRERHLD